MEFSFLFKNDELHQQASSLVERDSCNFQLSSKYRFYYRFLRPLMPIFVRQMLQRRQNVKVEDGWYLPTAFMKMLANCLAKDDLSTIHPWPNAARFGFVLTHDVETAEGMRHIIRIANLEEQLGFRSSWNLVPYKYKIDMGIVKELQSRGFEIGIHGFNHDGQLYSSREVFERRAVEINRAIAIYGAVGFRSPMVHRNLDWLQSLDIEYDSSCFDIDPFQAASGGVGSIWPFVAGKFVELPYTMPQDHTLFVALGEQDERIWKEKLDFIMRHQGMALMLTHPDYLTSQKETGIYLRFLEHVKATGDYWHGTPTEVANWWREREQAVEFYSPGAVDFATAELAGTRSMIADVKFDITGFQFDSRT